MDLLSRCLSPVSDINNGLCKFKCLINYGKMWKKRIDAFEAMNQNKLPFLFPWSRLHFDWMQWNLAFSYWNLKWQVHIFALNVDYSLSWLRFCLRYQLRRSMILKAVLLLLIKHTQQYSPCEYKLTGKYSVYGLGLILALWWWLRLHLSNFSTSVSFIWVTVCPIKVPWNMYISAAVPPGTQSSRPNSANRPL